jgi:hypothetical protein
MFTVVDESGGAPLGVIKRGKPRKGDTIWIENSPYKVVDKDRDVLKVRGRYASNPPEDDFENPVRMAGYRRNLPLPDDLKTYKGFSEGPTFPGFGRGHQQQMPFFTPSPVSEAQPSYQPTTFIAYHETAGIPILKIESAYMPQMGQIYEWGGWQYQVTGGEGTNLTVKPIPPWKYIAVALKRGTTQAVHFVPMAKRSDLSDMKYLLNQVMKDAGYARSEYNLTYKPLSQIKRFFKNNPPELLTYSDTEE